MTNNDTRKDEGLKSLGRNTEYRTDYAPEVLETFVNKHQENDYWVRFNCPEFTSLCPITGQPDFAEIRISYIPDVKMVESKSLKLYLFSFRNHGDFHEDCVNIIMKDLIRLMDPKYIEVKDGTYTVRYTCCPAKKQMDSASDYSGYPVGERLMAYGVAAEYCLICGNFEESECWENRYKDEIERLRPHERTRDIRARRWV